MATLYFEPASIEMPAVGQTFEVALKYREALSNVDGFYLYVLYDRAILSYDWLIDAIQEVDFNVTRFHNLFADDGRSGLSFRSGRTRTTVTPFNPLVSGTDLTFLTLRFRVLQQQATALNIGVGSTIDGTFYTESEIFISGGDPIVPTFERCALTVGGVGPPAVVTPTTATFTITTTDTDIQENETVDFTIAADIDVTDFVQSDITVTGATINSLSGSGRSWTLNVTAAAGAGNIVISIAQDAVSPGNHAVSETFTRSASTPPPVNPPVDPPTTTTAPLKQYSYRGHPVAVTIKIHDQDVTDGATLDDIQQSLDYPNLTEFRVGEASFTLKDVPGDFSPNKTHNFFTQHGGRRTGYHSPVKIEVGFIVDGARHTETIFQGNIIRLVQDAKAATVKVVCSDNFGDMRTKGIADFGISRHFRLLEDLEHAGENGFYPIMDAIMPASHRSTTLKIRVTDTPITPVQKLATEGTLNPRNFVIDDAGIRTEGGVITGAQYGYPQIEMKSPYRSRHIKDIIADILNHAGIAKSDISIPAQDVDAHFSSNGRVNYDLIGNIGSSNPVTWNGYVTDFLYDSGNDKWYFLYNRHRGNPNGISQIIVYDVATRTYSQLHKFASATEVWKFVKDGNNLYILGTTGGNYDAKEVSSENQIIQLDITGPTETVFVAHTNALVPQLAHYYHGIGIFMMPDSRRKIIYHGNSLYYSYADNLQFGVAKATAANTTETVITINQDRHSNHAGISFIINNGVLYGATTFVSAGKSQILVFKKTL